MLLIGCQQLDLHVEKDRDCHVHLQDGTEVESEFFDDLPPSTIFILRVDPQVSAYAVFLFECCLPLHKNINEAQPYRIKKICTEHIAPHVRLQLKLVITEF